MSKPATATATFLLDVKYDPEATDPLDLSILLDSLLESACSTPGILADAGEPVLDEFYVAAKKSPRQLVLNLHGGVLQDAFGDDPQLEVTLVDWDNEDATDPRVVKIRVEGGETALAYVTRYPVAPLSEIKGSMTAAAIKKAGLSLYFRRELQNGKNKGKSEKAQDPADE